MNDPPKPMVPSGAQPAEASPAGTVSPQACAEALHPRSIGDLAREFDISTRAIRFYEARGLISPDRRGSVRIFGDQDRRRLALIVRAKKLGLSLGEIGEHLAIFDAQGTDPRVLEDLKRRADRHIAALREKRSDLQATLSELRRIRAAIVSRLALRRQQRH